MRINYYEQRPSQQDSSKTKLILVSDPSKTSTTLISPREDEPEQGCFVSTQNFAFVLYSLAASRNDVGKQYLHETANIKLCQQDIGLGNLKEPVGNKAMKALRSSRGTFDYGFAELHQKLALMKRELELIAAVTGPFVK
ncbi:MAG: hypothetical protein Q9166_005868 [cf. Caloplaca sp. 2 TL-2023]